MFELKTLGLFVVTAIAAIVGCYLPYLWLKKSAPVWVLLPATASLALFVWLLALHPTAAGRVYARAVSKELPMKTLEDRPRLKGLDEMPRPRRTLRQRYFSVRSGHWDSTLSGWLWAGLVLAILLSIFWGIARLLGLPIEQWVREWLDLLR